MSGRILPFNDRAVAAAPFVGAAKEVEYRLQGHPGLLLVVQRPKRDKSATRVWRYQYSLMISGKQVKRRVGLGRYPAQSLADAAARAGDYRVRVERGEDIAAILAAAEVEEERASLTFSDLFEEYLVAREGLVRIDEVRREIAKDALPILGAMKPQEITTADIDAVGQRIFERNPKARTVAYRVAMHLKALFNYILLDRPGLAAKYNVTDNPAAKLGRSRRGLSKGQERGYSKPEPRRVYLDDNGIARWWAALEDSGTRDATKLALKLVLVTAQRPGEVRQARASELHLEGPEPYWLIPTEKAKNIKEHYVPLSALAIRLFREALAASPSPVLVFPDPEDSDAPLSKFVLPTAQANLFRIQLADMKRATVHDLRRTATTGMRRLGVDRDIVALILNHSARDVTGRHYDHHDARNERREALNLWAEHLENLLVR